LITHTYYTTKFRSHFQQSPTVVFFIDPQTVHTVVIDMFARPRQLFSEVGFETLYHLGSGIAHCGHIVSELGENYAGAEAE